MKNLISTAIFALMCLPMFSSFAEVSEEQVQLAGIDICSAYCTGYADGKDPGNWTLKKWNSVYENCKTWSSFCKEEQDGPDDPGTGLE